MTPIAGSSPHDWSFRPAIVASLVVIAGLYGWRLWQMNANGELRRSDVLRGLAFTGGLVVLLLAFVSPLDGLGEQRLFTAHMAQHLMIGDVAPILLLLGLSRKLLRPVVRGARGVEQSLGTLAHPLAALMLLAIVMWTWHVPAAYELALDNALVHQLEHALFFTAGLVFWWFVIEPVPVRHRLRGMATLAYVAGAKVVLGTLGVALAFSPRALYDTYEQAPRTWGLSPVQDLNVGGLVMMLEQSVVLLVFFAIVFARMLDQSERAQRRRERFGI